MFLLKSKVNTISYLSIIIKKRLPTSANLTFGYDGTTFTAESKIDKTLSLIPQLGISLESLNLTHGANKLWDFSVISKLDLFGTELPGKVLIPSSGDPSFEPTMPNGGIHVNFPGAFDPVFKTLNISLGNEYAATGTAVIKKQQGNTITGALINDVDLNFKVTKANGWSLDTDAAKTATNVNIPLGNDAIDINSFHISRPQPNAKLIVGGNATFSFGNNKAMDAIFEVDQTTTTVTVPNFEIFEGLKLEAIAEVIGSGTANIGSFAANITLGSTPDGPVFEFQPRSSAPLKTVITDKTKKLEAVFKSGRNFKLATNTLGIPTLTFESMEFRIDDPKQPNKPFFDLSTEKLVFYLPGAAGTGMLFFDKFSGIVKVAGLDCHVELKFPDPLSSSNSAAAMNDIKGLLEGKMTFVQALSNIKAPSFSVNNSYVILPPKLFGNNARLKIPNKTYNLDILKPLATGADDLSKMTTNFLKNSLKAISGTHETSVLGVMATSKLSFDGKSFKSEVDFNASIGNHTKLDAVLIGNFSNTSFKLETTGDVEVKGGSTWKKMSGAQITFSEKGISFGAKLFNAEGKGIITKAGFGFKGHINTSTFKGEINATPKSFYIKADAYVGGHKITHIDTGFKEIYIDIKVKGHPTGKNYDFKYDGYLRLGITKPSATCKVSVNGKIGISKIKIKSELKVRHNYISGDLKAGFDCYYFRVYLNSHQGKNKFSKTKC